MLPIELAIERNAMLLGCITRYAKARILTTIGFAAMATLSACSTAGELRKEAQIATATTFVELDADPSRFEGQKILIRGCLDFHGRLRRNRWSFNLTPLEGQDSISSIFVDGALISPKYRKRDIYKETQTGETTFTRELVKDYEWQVEVFGTFLNETQPLVGGHVVFADFYKYTVVDAVVSSELREGCEEG